MNQTDLTQVDLEHPRHALRDALLDGRLLSVLLSCSLIFNMVDPALLILKEPASLVSHIARITHSPVAIAATFLLMAALAAPFMVMQTFAPKTRHRRRVIRLGCLALCCGGLLWVFLAYLSRNLDYATVTGIFIRNGAWNIALAAVLANSINNEQKRASDGAST
ncbi:hypothetical protein [Polaromonas sp.]|uniref:hypothetical protein n=1 Tax=Polaromonas sp. TaxID=1869339 RepID=UPI003264FFA6